MCKFMAYDYAELKDLDWIEVHGIYPMDDPTGKFIEDLLVKTAQVKV